jgi:hypothetical protein
MNPKDALLKIRALFEDMPQEPLVAAAPMEVPAPAETKVQMAEYSLVDGTKVMISSLEIGGMVELADGTPAPIGEHQLADGTSIQVDEAGLIIEIASPKEDMMPEEEPVAPAAPVAPAQDVTAMVAEVESKFNAQKEQLEQKISDLENKVKQGFAQVAELVEALSNVPSSEPTQKSANAFSTYISTNDIKEERIAKYRNAILNK